MKTPRDPACSSHGWVTFTSAKWASFEPALTPNQATLAELIEDTGARTLSYLYDFGDSWEHKIKIGKVGDPVPGELYPRLTDIAGRCPPEDVGGFPGYEEFLEAIGGSILNSVYLPRSMRVSDMVTH